MARVSLYLIVSNRVKIKDSSALNHNRSRDLSGVRYPEVIGGLQSDFYIPLCRLPQIGDYLIVDPYSTFTYF